MEQKPTEQEFKRLAETLEANLKERYVAERRWNRYRIDDFELLRNYLEVKAKLGHVPLGPELDNLGRYSKNSYRNHFGTYWHFLAILGERPFRAVQQPKAKKAYFSRHRLKRSAAMVAIARLPKNFNKQKWPTVLELIKEYGRLLSELQRPPKPEEIEARSAYSLEAYKRVFYTFDRLNDSFPTVSSQAARNRQSVTANGSRRQRRKRQ